MIRRGTAAFIIYFLLSMSALADTDNGRPIATILCYHVVESPSDTRFAISREEFLRQIRYLTATGYNIIPLGDLVRYYRGEIETLPERAVVITVDDGWKCTYDVIYKELSRLDIPFTAFLYPKYIIGGNYSLTWDQVREMAQNGVDIQSHTLSHGYLTRHESGQGSNYASWLMNELKESKRILEEKTGKQVDVLAYPYGAYDGVVKAATEKAGYSAALTCNFGSVADDTDPFLLHRVVIEATTTFDQFRRYLGAGKLEVTDISPSPGRKWNPAYPVVGARILDPKSIDPASVQMTLLDGAEVPFFYDPRDGSISLVLKEGMPAREQSVLVWAEHFENGTRLEAMWSFRPETIAPTVASSVVAGTLEDRALSPALTGGTFE